MLFEVFLVYYAREHTEIPATRIVNIAKKVYAQLEDAEPVLNPGEKLENKFDPIKNELKKESVEWTGQLQKYLEKEVESLSFNADLKGQVTINHYPFDSEKSYGFTIDFYNPTDAKIFQSEVQELIKTSGWFTQSDMWALLGGKYNDWVSCHFGWKNSDMVADIKVITIPLANKEYYRIILPASDLLIGE
jgi:hypothetical protein